MNSRRSLRTRLREARRELPAGRRADAARAVCTALLSNPRTRKAERIGAFVAFDAELDPAPFVAAARALGREIHLPVLGADGRLDFVRHAADQPLFPNRYGIPEPKRGPGAAPQFLDLVLVPLVGFDGAGNRLGMGAGFYDRTFAFRLGRDHWTGPLLIGLGYECQRVDKLTRQPWDVPLDGVATENGLVLFDGNG